MMAVTSDLSVWKSPDLVHWLAVRETPRQSTVVWNIDRDGTWMKPMHLRDGEPFRPLRAPEIHYINRTFWIPSEGPIAPGSCAVVSDCVSLGGVADVSGLHLPKWSCVIGTIAGSAMPAVTASTRSTPNRGRTQPARRYAH